MYYFYLPDGLESVTQYYADIIRDALALRGEEWITTGELRKIPKGAKIFTITDKTCVEGLMSRRPIVAVNWYQGVAPEETALLFASSWTSKPRMYLHNFLEGTALRRCALNLFVSSAQLTHYREKYNYRGDNYFIMPCFNAEYRPEDFNQERYSAPSFVYVGNMAAWQCFDDTLELFKAIKAEVPAATLDVFTGDGAEAKRLLDKHGVQARVDFVRPEALQKMLSKYKYGFIVRDDSVINRVATPTKMGNYMASGIIPVFTDNIMAYKENITPRCRYAVSFRSHEECVKKIVRMESERLDVGEHLEEIERMFASYWNRDDYVRQLSQAMP